MFHSCVPGREIDRHMIDFYATPGKARQFIAGAGQKNSDSYGATIYRGFSSFFKGRSRLVLNHPSSWSLIF